MALAFVRASGQYAEAAGSPLASTPSVFTVACWYKPSSIANGTALGLGDTGGSSYCALGMNASGNAFIETTGNNATAGVLTNGAWAHIAGVQSSATSRIAYKDGVAGSADTGSGDVFGANRVTAGGLMLNGTRLSFAGGSVAHVAIWSSALTAGNVASLAGGARPDAVSSGTLVFYSELVGTASPEDDLVGALDLVWGAGGAAPSQDTNNPAVGGTTVSLTTVTETDSAVAVSAQKVAALTSATEADAAQALVWQYFKALVPATEADVAVSLAFTGGSAPRSSQRVGWGVGVRSPGAESILAR
jgi:hypothetical protein